MKKSMFKVFLSLLVSLALIAQPYSIVFAKETAQSTFTKPESVDASKEVITKELIKMGFTDEEIVELFKMDEQRAMKTRAIPDNPSIGDRHTEYFTISNTALGLPFLVTGIAGITQGEIAKNIVRAVGASAVLWAFTVAGVVLSYWNSNAGYRGYKFSIQYYYGYDNDGLINWTVGPINVSPYK